MKIFKKILKLIRNTILMNIFPLMFLSIIIFFLYISAYTLLFIPTKLVEGIGEVAQAVSNTFTELTSGNLNTATEVEEERLTEKTPFDLSPMPIEKTTCGGSCSCERDDKYFENYVENGEVKYRRIQETKRLNTGLGTGRTSWKNKDWMYTGWTIDNYEYWDVDFSKFSHREVANEDREYLFKWGVNRMDSHGKQLITLEDYNAWVNPIDIDESSRNGSFVNISRYVENSTGVKEPMQYIDFENAMFRTKDSRIQSAFAPMVTAGQKGFENLLKARQWFHKGDVWGGTNLTDTNWFTNGKLNLWSGDIGRGSFIDVVFEDENNRQFVIPFIYMDAKNLHWFDGSGQQVDQRYGQVKVIRSQANNNGSYKEVNSIYKGKFKFVCDTETDLQQLINNDGYRVEFPDFIKIHSVASNNYFLNFENIRGGKVVDFLDSPEHFKKVLFRGVVNPNTNPPTAGYFELTDFEERQEEKEIFYFSDDDILSYQCMTALELMHVYYDKNMKETSPKQDMNKLVMNYLLTDNHYDGTVVNSWPNVEIVGMRVYKDAQNDSESFTEKSKKFEEIDKLPANHKIITYCNTDCHCNICSEIAR